MGFKLKVYDAPLKAENFETEKYHRQVIRSPVGHIEFMTLAGWSSVDAVQFLLEEAKVCRENRERRAIIYLPGSTQGQGQE
jgi:hypothetical protein